MGYELARTGAQVKAALDASTRPGEPNGFVDASAVTIAWDTVSRTLTVSPVGDSFDAWINGVLVTYSNAQAAVWADVEGTKLFSFAANNDNALTAYNSFDPALIETDALVAYGYWDAQNKELLLDAMFDERHGYQLPVAVHTYLHNYDGARYGGGLDLVLGGVDENGNEDAHAQFTLSAGSIADEDIVHAIGAKAALTDSFRVLYQLGVPGTWRQAPASSFPVVLAEGACQYNLYDGGVYQLSPVPNNDYFFAHIAVTGTLSGPAYFVLLGQAAYSNANQARTAAASEIARLNLDGLPAPEIVILYSVLLQYQSGDDNAAKAHFVSLDDGDYIDHRAAKGGAGASALATPGSALAARSTATISGGAVSFTLSNAAYTCQLTEDATPSAPLPPGGNAEDFAYSCQVDFLAPDAGGPFTLSIPAGWLQAGPLAAIALSAGDAPIRCVLSTLADGTIAFDAVQTVVA